MNGLLSPHGGKLVERQVRGAEREERLHQARLLPAVTLDAWELAQVEMFATGALSPLEGFLREADYDSVVDRMQLSDGTVWPLPVTLSLTEGEADLWREGKDLALKTPDGQQVAVLHQPELFPYNRMVEAKLVYGTTDPSHPGVARVLAQGPYYVGGRLSVLDLPGSREYAEYRLTPAQTRQEFARRGWQQVVGFQATGPIHRAHEYLLRCALETADGLMIHPAVGKDDGEDLPAAIRLRCIRALLDHYFPLDRAMLVVNPMVTRFGGPREAIFHAILRQNYGCSHFIIGRDLASVGKFYGPMDAQKIFERYGREQLAVTPLFFDNAFYCGACQGMATIKTCAHPISERVTLSGTAVRQILAEGKEPPPEFTRPEIAEILKEAYPAPGEPAADASADRVKASSPF